MTTTTQRWRHLWHLARLGCARFSGAPALVCERWSGEPEELAAALGCAEDTALRVGLCAVPFAVRDRRAWAVATAARFGLDVDRVERLAAQLATGRWR